MTIEEFLEKWDLAPLEPDELAEIAIKVKGDLGETARKYLIAHRDFYNELEKHGFEWG